MEVGQERGWGGGGGGGGGGRKWDSHSEPGSVVLFTPQGLSEKPLWEPFNWFGKL